MSPRPKDASNVVKLSARKAKGSRSTGGRKPASRMKPQPGASSSPPRTPSDEDVRRASQDRLVALRGLLIPVEQKMGAAQDVVAGLREQKLQIRTSIQTIVPLSVYDEADKKLKLKTKRSDQEAYEKARALAFEAFGLAVGPQAELELAKVPEAARPGLHWRAVGYQAAIDGLFSDYKRDAVPEDGDSIQNYQAGFADGTAANARGIKLLKTDEKKPKADPKAAALPPASIPGGEAKAAAKEAAQADAPEIIMRDGKVTAVGFSQPPALWNDVQREAFRTWFEALADDADVDILDPNIAAAFDEAVASEGEAAAEGFDAPAEELAGQSTRKAVQERREFAD